MDEPELSDRREHESASTFRARLEHTGRVVPLLRELVANHVALVVEQDRRSSHGPQHLSGDFVLELGDSRVRLILTPGESGLGFGSMTVHALRHYLLDVPDTDALAVVADDDQLSTWVLDAYDLNTDAGVPPAVPLLEALGAFFDAITRPIEFPDLGGALDLPSSDELATRLSRAVQAEFQRVSRGRAQIQEKVEALQSLDDRDLDRLTATLTACLRGEAMDVGLLLDGVETDD